jgi:hypothetical protein
MPHLMERRSAFVEMRFSGLEIIIHDMRNGYARVLSVSFKLCSAGRGPDSHTTHCILNYTISSASAILSTCYKLTLSKLIQRIKTLAMRGRMPAEPPADFQHLDCYLGGEARI